MFEKRQKKKSPQPTNSNQKRLRDTQTPESTSEPPKKKRNRKFHAIGKRLRDVQAPESTSQPPKKNKTENPMKTKQNQFFVKNQSNR